jgi:hypothetical protein
MTRHVSAFLLTALMLILPTPADAQSPVPPPPPPKEPIALGGVLGVGFPAQLVSVRLSLPLGKALALDLDAGRIHGLGDDGQVAGGGGYGAQLRWLWHGRSATGHSGYWLAGPLYLQATNRQAGVVLDRRPIKTVQIGYGWDWIATSGTRAGVELSTGGGEGPVFLVNVFFQRVLSR